MNNNLDFYIVNDNYIKFLSFYDKHIAHNKNMKRPYVGIVLQINNISYFAPMYSPKPQHKKYKDNLTFFKIYQKTSNKKNYLGLIRFSDMIPISNLDLIPINIKSQTNNYIRLMNMQHNYINKPENKKEIFKKAKSLYEIITKGKNNKTNNFYKNISCNFELLEEKYNEWVNMQNQQNFTYNTEDDEEEM